MLNLGVEFGDLVRIVSDSIDDRRGVEKQFRVQIEPLALRY